MEEELQPAAYTLNASLNNKTLNPYYSGTAAFGPLDIQVATQSGGSNLIAKARTGYQLGTGAYTSANNALLIAQDGNDTLDDTAAASGTANALIGGTGDNVFKVGNGNDYIVAGSGDALIEGGTAANSAIGSGADTIVLGDANTPWDGGDDTVWGGSGNDVYYLGLKSQYTNIHLGTGHSTINVVENPTDIVPLTLDAAALMAGLPSSAPLTESIYEDHTNHKLIESTLNPDGTKRLEIFALPPLVANAPAPAPANLARAPIRSLATASTTSDAAAGVPATDGTGELILDGYTGSNLSGITLNDANATAPGANDLSHFTATTYSDHTEYQDHSGTGGSDSMNGVATTGGNYNILEGEGNASYIYAGDGNNDAFADDLRNSPVGWVFSQPHSVMIQGGTGNQLLVGLGVGDNVGSGHETIMGGAMGSDTTAWTTIDGGGANVDALLTGGAQNSLILGGLGTDTIMAGAATQAGQPDPETFALAGLSFWAYYQQEAQGGGADAITGEPEVSIPAATNPANFQMEIALDQLDVNQPVVPPDQLGTSYGAPFGLLGSVWDTGTDTSPWKDSSGAPMTLPGSLLIGGSGFDALIGNSGSDTIIGGTPAHPTTGVVDEVLVGGGGANLIYGGDGTEWIYADLSPGADAQWADLDPADSDTIYGGSGSEYIYGSGGNDAIYGGSGNYTIYTGNGNSYVQTGTGTALVYGGSGKDTIEADGTADNIWTGAGSNTIILDAGNDSVSEGSGPTTLVTGLSTGSDTIQVGGGTTTIDLAAGITSDDLVVRDVNGNLALTDAGTGGVLSVANYFNGGTNVSLQFDDGTTWSAAQILQASMTPSKDGGNDTLVGSNGNDSITAGDGNTLIIGTTGNNTLTGGTGNDTIQGGIGADTIEGGSGTSQLDGGTGTETYVFNIGDGSSTINENTSSAGTDTLKFGSGILSSDVHFALDASNDLVITFGSDSNSTITVPNFLIPEPSQHQIGSFQFADGTSLTREQVIQPLVTINGTTGDDALYGKYGRPNYFDGKGGNDVEYGNSGYDTFVFDAGYGSLKIEESYVTYINGVQPVLKLGPGITASSLHLSGDDNIYTNGMILTDGVSGDQIILDGMFDSSTLPNALEGVQEVQFADGTTLTRNQLIQDEIDSGTPGNDCLQGFTWAAYFDEKGGNDTAIGESGSDTFVFNQGYGHLVVDERYAAYQNSVLQLGNGLSQSSLQVRGSGNDILLTDGVSGDQVVLKNMLGDVNGGIVTDPTHFGVSTIRFSDGTELSRAQLILLATTGTPGNDSLYGTIGDDYFDGKGGNDIEYGYDGADTFVFNSGYGQLEINTHPTKQMAIIQLGAGITLPDLKVEADGQGTDADNIYITDGIAGDRIKIDSGVQLTGYTGYGNNTPAPLEVKLSDGTILSIEQLVQIETSQGGTPGDDTLYGAIGNELFDGKGGNDIEYGGGGSDTFVFDPGYGKLTIIDFDYYNGSSVLKLGNGISQASLKVVEDMSRDLVITDGIQGDEITIPLVITDWNANSSVQTVQFADGSTLSKSQLEQMAVNLAGTTGSDTLVGTVGADYFDGKGGNDSALGNGGNDTFVFDAGYGDLEIDESYASGQQPLLQLGAGIALSALRVTVEGNNLLLTDGIGGDQVTLLNMATSSASGVASVALANGTTLTAAQLLQMTRNIYGTTGNDTLTGTSGAELIDGEGGKDSIIGNGGSDTFVFDSGYGQLTINESFTNGQQPVLELGADITPSTLRVSTGGSNVVLTDGISGDQITLLTMWTSSTHGVATVQLADGTVLTRNQLIQMEMAGGTTGNDTIYGTSGADLLDGKGGSDSIVGGGGNDTFVFNAGYGHLAINESFASGQHPTLKLGSGIAASALRVTTNGANVVLTDGISGDQITLTTMWTSTTHGVSTVQLADGTTFTASQLIQMEMTGTTGNDTIYGTSGADLLDGKGGSDSLIGGGGNDTFVFDAGYGHLIIKEIFTSGQTPVLKLGAGITSSALHVAISGGNLLLTDGVSGDQITLNSMATSSTNGVATVQLVDGTILTAAQLKQIASSGGSVGTSAAHPTSGVSAIGLADEAVTAGSSALIQRVASATPAIGAGHMVLPGTQSGHHAPVSPAASHGPATPSTTRPATGLHPAVAHAAATAEPAQNLVPLAHAAAPAAASGLHRLGSSHMVDPVESTPLATGAPVDPMRRDSDDASVWPTWNGLRGESEADDAAPHDPGTFLRDTGVLRSRVHRLLLGRTADAANDMIKALTAQGGLRPSGSAAADPSASQVRLQDGTLWSLSPLDKVLSAAATAARRNMRAGAASAAFGSADLVHAQLVSAMATFGPVSAAQTALPPTVSEADAIALAVQAH